MKTIFGLILILITTLSSQGHQQFGKDCGDISCEPGQKCVISQIPCNNPEDKMDLHCGKYPECRAVLHRTRRSPQMPYQPVGMPVPLPPPVYPAPGYMAGPQPRQAMPQYAVQARPQLYFSMGMGYPSYMNYNGRSFSSPSTSFYSPFVPNYSTYNYNINLPFSGGSS
ncbi:uncharacterized protein LOC6506385 isoform X2 [Drosophila ananassae]|uniref:uncharacterized protein LOC6506385 isoform X2 n=1 Tax=Drosophila ananassae TaxID=7217 RepID=UPI0013A5EC15|nr:uncharacterized protein LOC6506385 isoform X2 [Drosophila ananassae]